LLSAANATAPEALFRATLQMPPNCTPQPAGQDSGEPMAGAIKTTFGETSDQTAPLAKKRSVDSVHFRCWTA